MSEATSPTTYSQILRYIRSLSIPISPRYSARLQDAADDIPAIRRVVHVKLRQFAYRAEVESSLDALESLGADGWLLYLGLQLHAEELQVKQDVEIGELQKTVDTLTKRRRKLKREVKKLGKMNKALMRVLLDGTSGTGRGADQATQVPAIDLAALPQIQRSLEVIHKQLQGLNGGHQSGIRGGMGGQLEDEEHVYSYTKYRNWDQKSDENEQQPSRLSPKAKTERIQGLRSRIEALKAQLRQLEDKQQDETSRRHTADLDSSPGTLGPNNEGFGASAGSVTVEVDEETGDAQLHPSRSYEVMPGYKDSGEYSPKLPQMSLDNEPLQSDRIQVLNTTAGDEEQARYPFNTSPRTSGEHQGVPSVRGGYEHRFDSIPHRFDEYHSLVQDFDNIYSQLLQNTFSVCGRAPPTCTQAWMSAADVLLLRNRYLEQQFEQFRETYDSTVEDLRWNMNALSKLEDEAEVLREEKANALMELGFLKRRLEKEEHKEQRTGDVKRGITPMDPCQHQELDGYFPNSSALHELPDLPGLDAHTHEGSSKSFYFYPSRSLIVVPGSPAQILQFERGVTLHDIREIVDARHRSGARSGLCASLMKEIMDIRDRMGIGLPEPLADEAVLISVPEPRQQTEDVEHAVKVAAWESMNDDEHVDFIPRRQEAKQDAQQPAVVFPRSEGTLDNNTSRAGNVFDSFQFSDNGEVEESLCSCPLCTNSLHTTAINPYAPIPSVRCGPGDESHPEHDYLRADCRADEEDYGETNHEDEAATPWVKGERCAIYY
jgi:cell division protein FtsB